MEERLVVHNHQLKTEGWKEEVQHKQYTLKTKNYTKELFSDAIPILLVVWMLSVGVAPIVPAISISEVVPLAYWQ